MADRISPPPLHELDREAMEAVWQRGDATVRDVLGDLNDRRERELAYTTVLTVLGTLHRKGLLTRRREGRSDVYAPAMPRDEYVDSRARSQVNALIEEYGDVALTHFAREVARLEPEQRRRLQELAGDG